ncbi:MAG: hypothetical protein IPM29_17100 [Planctomycetes bacterium]|nr:hypothetical protein [Planctomycetota bacterium]
MFDAQLVHSELNGGTVELYSPWFPRAGDYARATIDVVEYEGSAGWYIEVVPYHKNAEDSGDGTAASGSTVSRSTTGRTTQEWGPFKELVRYKFRVAGTEQAAAWVLFRMLTLVWFDAA